MLELLNELLRAHERSISYGRPAPWPRDVILKLNPKTFPDAFAPDGRERRGSIVAAAKELESRGCVRIVYHTRGPLSGEPNEIRLGHANIELAYSHAQHLGFEPLAMGLTAVSKHALELANDSGPHWMKSFLERLATDIRQAQLTLIGMQRERFKREWRELLTALTVAAALARGITPNWERVISERILDDSKLLARIRPHVVSILLNADPRWSGVPLEEAVDLLEVYGVRRKPGLIRCAGAAALNIGGRLYYLEDFVPVAHIPDGWGDAWVNAVLQSGVKLITTIENEYPFLSYVEDAGGPSGLGARHEIAVFTSGFPTPALVSLLSRLDKGKNDLEFRHWGDADVGGVRIWWFIRQRLQRPVQLFRTTAAWVASESSRGGKRLSVLERVALQRLRAELEPLPENDAAEARDVIDVLLEQGRKIEQERF
jgi:hypothetical protein